MKAALWALIIGLAACSSQEKAAKPYTALNVVLYPGFFDQPVCLLLSPDMQPVIQNKLVPNQVTEIAVPDYQKGLIVRCEESESTTKKMVFHSVWLPSQTGKNINIAVNPLTEIAYRLSSQDITSYAVHLSRLLLNMGMYVGSPEGLLPMPVMQGEKIQDYYGSMIELLLITSGLKRQKSEREALALNDRMSRMESATRDDLSVSSVYTQTELKTFLSEASLSENLIDFYKNNYTEKMPQLRLYFPSLTITRFLSTGEFSQPVQGGSGKGEISYQVSDTEIASIDAEGKVTLLRVGEATITAIKAEDDSYKSAQATYDIVIARDRKQQLSFSFDSDQVEKKLTDGEFIYKVKGGNGEGLVFYRSSDSRKAEVFSDGRVVLKDLGKVTVTAFKGGDDAYHKAESSYQLSIDGTKFRSALGETSPVDDLRKLVPKLQPGDTLYLSGEYFFDPPLRLQGLKGREDAPIRVVGFSGAETAVTGVQPLETVESGTWQLVDDNASKACQNHCYKIKVNKPVLDLWVGKRRQKVASWPNYTGSDLWQEITPQLASLVAQSGGWWDEATWARSSDTRQLPRDAGGFVTTLNNDNSTHQLSHLPSFTDGRLLIKDQEGNHQDTRIASHQSESTSLTFFSEAAVTLSKNILFRVEHAHALDQESEYFYDATTSELWVWPIENKHPKALNLTVRIQTHAIDVIDSEYIEFDNISFHDTTLKCTGSCKGLSVENSLFKNAVPYRTLLKKSLWPALAQLDSHLSFDPALLSPSYFQVDAQPWASDITMKIVPHADQRYWLPLWSGRNQANMPFSTESHFLVSAGIDIKWLPVKGSIKQQIWVGESMADLQVACREGDIQQGTLSRCQVATALKPETTYYWQIVNMDGEVSYKSPFYHFITEAE